MAERPSSAQTGGSGLGTADGRDRGSTPAELVYANVKRCTCGRPIDPPEPGQVGRRARYCGYCKQVREALRFARAAVRRLERIQDPKFLGGRP